MNQPNTTAYQPTKTAVYSTPQDDNRLPGPPPLRWQKAAMTAVADCTNNLIHQKAPGATAVYAHLKNNMGLSDDTIAQARLGWNPQWRIVATGGWLAPGITIPCIICGDLWYLQVRTTQAARERAQQRGRELGTYRPLLGSQMRALYRADSLKGATTAVIVNSELKALLLSQSTPPETAVVTMGEGESPNARWYPHFAHLHRLFIANGVRRAKEWEALVPWMRNASPPRKIIVPDDSWMERELSERLGELKELINQTEPGSPTWVSATAEYEELMQLKTHGQPTAVLQT